MGSLGSLNKIFQIFLPVHKVKRSEESRLILFNVRLTEKI